MTNSSGDHFYSVSETSISSGLITDDMYKLEGIQLYDGPFLAGLILGLLLMILLYFHSEWYVVNTVGVLVGAGVIVMLGVAFVPTLIIIFMILAAIYDAWAVYKSKHMLELADTMIGLQLPILLVAPQDKDILSKKKAKKRCLMNQSSRFNQQRRFNQVKRKARKPYSWVLETLSSLVCWYFPQSNGLILTVPSQLQ